LHTMRVRVSGAAVCTPRGNSSTKICDASARSVSTFTWSSGEVDRPRFARSATVANGTTGVVGSDMTAHLLSKGLLLGVLLGLGLRTSRDALVAESLVPAGRRLSDGDLRPGRGRQRNRLHGHL